MLGLHIWGSCKGAQFATRMSPFNWGRSIVTDSRTVCNCTFSCVPFVTVFDIPVSHTRAGNFRIFVSFCYYSIYCVMSTEGVIKCHDFILFIFSVSVTRVLKTTCFFIISIATIVMALEKQIGWASWLASARWVTLVGGTTFLQINTLAHP